MIIHSLYKAIRKINMQITSVFNHLICTVLLKGNNIRYNSFRTSGIPYIMVARGGECSIGHNFSMNNGIKGNPIGYYEQCTFFVDRGAKLNIGNHVGISQSALICHESINIGSYVKIGGGTKIYDTDFHPLDPKLRVQENDIKHKAKAPVIIKDNVFIGAGCIILKGVTIGKNSVIGAGSIVTKSVPDNQIWGGNPAKFIKIIE